MLPSGVNVSLLLPKNTSSLPRLVLLIGEIILADGSEGNAELGFVPEELGIVPDDEGRSVTALRRLDRT